jgi:hypothetical protein
VYYTTYHSRFIPERVAEACQVFLRDAHVLPKLLNIVSIDLAMKNTADVPGGNPIAVRSHSILDVSAVNPLVAFYDIYRRHGDLSLFFFLLDSLIQIHCEM